MVQNHSNGHTPDYIKALLAPSKSSRGSRRAWSIDVESVWVPFFTATNVMGETNLADDVLGAPIRLAKGKDGEVRFTQSGMPVMRVHKDLNNQINVVRENFIAGLQAYTGSVMEERPDAYGEQVSRAQAAGLPIMEQDQADIQDAEEKLRAQQAEQTLAEGEHAPDSTPDSTPADGTAAKGRARNRTPDPEPATTPAS